MALAAAVLAAAIGLVAAILVGGGPPYALLVLEDFEEANGAAALDARGLPFTYSPTAGEIALPPGARRPRAGERVLLWRRGSAAGPGLRWVLPVPWGFVLGGQPPVRLVALGAMGQVHLRWRGDDIYLLPGEAWGTRLGEPGAPGTRVLRVRHEGLYDTLRLTQDAPTG